MATAANQPLFNGASRLLVRGATVTDHQVMVDGQPLQDNYVLELPNYLLGRITVPSGGLFVMGDNRNDSNDSQV